MTVIDFKDWARSDEVKRSLADARSGFATRQPSLASGIGDAHSTVMADEITDLRAQLAEAKTDKKFADMLGEVRAGFAGVDGRLSGLERQTAGVKSTVILTGLAVAALMLAVLTYGQAWFGIGVSTRDVVKSAVSEYFQQHPAAK